MKDINAKRRIALFIPTLSGGGAERNFINLSAEFYRLGFEVDLVVATLGGVFVDQIPAGVLVFDLKKNRILFSVLALLRYLKERRPDVLMSSINHANLIAIIAKLLSQHRFKLFVRESNTITDVLKYNSSWKLRIIPFLIFILYRFADGIIGISHDVCHRVKQTLLRSKVKVVHIPNPVIFPAIDELMKAALPLSLPPGDEYILSVGRLHPQKDFETLILAFSSIAKKYSRMHLVILGEGELKSTLKALIQKLGLQNKVHLLGFFSNPYPFFKRAKLFALTSRWEGFGNVIVEAMNFGVPCVLTECPGGPRQLIQPQVNGFLAPVGDAAGVAEKLELALNQTWDHPRIMAIASEYRSDRIAVQYLKAFGLIS